MKAISRLLVTGLASGLFILSSLPAASALDGQINTKVEGGQLCTVGLASLKTRLLAELDKRKSTRETKRDEISSKRAEDKANWEARIASARTTADAKRDAEFQALQDKATTETKKQAVAIFVSTVKAAIATRRASFEKARETFRKGVDELVTTHKTQADSQVSAYRLSVANAFTKAETSCASGTSGPEVLATLKTDLANARKTYQDGRQTDTTFAEQIKALEKTRKAALESAQKAFKETVEAARESLKKSWGSDSEI